MLKAVTMFQVVYTGDGVASNKLGVFQHGTTAYTPDEAIAREIAESSAFWRVTAPGGVILGSHHGPVAVAAPSREDEELAESLRFQERLVLDGLAAFGERGVVEGVKPSSPATGPSVDSDDHGGRQGGAKRSKSRGGD